MNRLLYSLLLIGLFFFVTNCSSSPDTSEDVDATEQTEETSTAATEQEQKSPVSPAAPVEKEKSPALVISTTSFAGIQPGDPITDHSTRLKKDLLRNGEGEFDIYTILDKNGSELGYAMPGYKDDKLLGDITITTPAAQTAAGIRVGMTYGELRKKVPGITVNGSEIEGYTYAHQGNIYYRLDSYNTTFELDPNSIDDGVKIIEIVLSSAQ